MSRAGQFTTGNTIFYSTANTGYAIYSAVSLLTVRDYIPTAKLCILSSGLSEYDKKILKKHDIEYYELDLRGSFTKTWEYPIDCYYIFAGPEMFHEHGFEYSVYIDGDILCRKNPINDIVGVDGIASAGQSSEYISIFGNDWGKISKLWDVPEDMDSRKRINSGVVYFNNRKMTQLSLQDKASLLFRESLNKGIPRKGDDSLLSLLQHVYLKSQDIRYLPLGYNFVLQFNNWRYPVEDLVFFHFTLDKPWKTHPYRHSDGNLDIFNPYVKIWRAKLRKIAPRVWLRSLLSDFLR